MPRYSSVEARIVLLSASFLQIALKLLNVTRHVKHQDQFGGQVCGHGYVIFVEMMEQAFKTEQESCSASPCLGS